LETRLSDLRNVWGRSTVIAVIGIFFPFIFAFALMRFTGASLESALFLGIACGATSVGITARVLAEMGVLKRRESRLILGAAVIDDILVLLLLTLVASYAKTHELHLIDSIVVVLQVVVFLAFAVFIAPKIMCGRFNIIDKFKARGSTLTLALVIMLGFSALSEYLGMAAIVGAFFAGMVFAESDAQEEILHQINPVFKFLVPFFFVVTGSMVDISVLADPKILGLGAAITVLAIAGKMLSGLAAGGRYRVRSALIVGVGMVPRGEVGLIVASLGLALGAVTQNDLSKVIFMSIATTLIVPPILHALLKPKKKIAVSEETPSI
jgi:Kef-type K+ transport system membrane component KefB